MLWNSRAASAAGSAAAAAALSTLRPSSTALGLSLIILSLLGAALSGLRLPIQILELAGLARTSRGLALALRVCLPLLRGGLSGLRSRAALLSRGLSALSLSVLVSLARRRGALRCRSCACALCFLLGVGLGAR
jgi:hypothetical protein